MNINKELLDSVLKNSEGNITTSDILKAKDGNFTHIFSKLSKEDSEKITDALNDKEKAKQILSSDAARKILKMLSGDKENGWH